MRLIDSLEPFVECVVVFWTQQWNRYQALKRWNEKSRLLQKGEKNEINSPIYLKGIEHMRARPIRSQIYLPVVRFGVVDADWKFVIFSTLLCYSIPFLFNLRIMNFPLEIWSTIIGLVASVGFFNFVRMGRRPFWLQHQIAALTKSTRHRHALPSDRKPSSWLLRA